MESVLNTIEEALEDIKNGKMTYADHIGDRSKNASLDSI
jgi:hypothetical protein